MAKRLQICTQLHTYITVGPQFLEQKHVRNLLSGNIHGSTNRVHTYISALKDPSLNPVLTVLRP